jgi:5S rRNA maturation endonuclease (ribonuclease M5)
MLKAILSAIKGTRSETFLDKNCHLFELRIREWARLPVKISAQPKRIGVLVCPWLTTAVPLFSLEAALMLRSEGHDVTILWDATSILFSTPSSEETVLLGNLIKKINKYCKVIDLRDARSRGDSLPRDLIKELLEEGAVKNFKGESSAKTYIQNNNEKAIADIESYSMRIHAVLDSKRFDWVLVPGGFFGPSCIYRAIAEKMGMDFTTYDSDFKILVLAHRGIAAQVGGVTDVFRYLNSLPKDDIERLFAIEQAAKQLETRELGRDVFHYQLVPRSLHAQKTFDVIVPLNYRPDTAALGRGLLFQSVEEWIREIGHWATTNKKWSVCFRQHPAERFAHVIATDDIGSLVRSLDPSGQYLSFVAADDSVNTYDLMEKCKVVLPFTSTLGIEAVYTGKPVILGTKCYYRDFGFTINPVDKDEYFLKLTEACEGAVDPSLAWKESAAIAYYVTQTCNFLNIPLTPLNEDYVDWSVRKPEELWNQKECLLLKEALLTRKQVAELLHREYFSNQRSQLTAATS